MIKIVMVYRIYCILYYIEHKNSKAERWLITVK